MKNPSLILASLLMAPWAMTVNLQAQPLTYTPSSPSDAWISSYNVWNQGSLPLVGWIQNSDALLKSGLEGELVIAENLQVRSIQQSVAGTSLNIKTLSSFILSLTGEGIVVSNTSGSDLTFADTTTVDLAPSLITHEQIWEADTNSEIVVDGVISGTIGTETAGVVAGGLVKTGAGVLQFNGSNTYTGVTTLRAGILEANHANALSASKIHFDGGVLRYGANAPVDGYSAQFLPTAAGKSARFDTNGRNDITFASGLTGSGGLEKLGVGILTLSSGNTYTGATVVREGVLRAAPGTFNSGISTFVIDPFGHTSSITVEAGATVDLNGNGKQNGSSSIGNARSYEINASGMGVAGMATIWNSGIGLTNTAAISKITFNSDISFGSNGRFDISGTTVEGGTHTLHKVGTGELAWTPAAGATVGNIEVKAGSFTIQSSNLGSTSHKFILTAGTTLQVWASGSATINKNVQTLGNVSIRTIGASPSPTGNNATTGNWFNDFDLGAGITTFTANSGFRQAVYTGVFSGAGEVIMTGSTSTSQLTPSLVRTSTHHLRNSANSFSGSFTMRDTIVRLSSSNLSAGTGGTLGATSNQVTLNASKSDGSTVLDLHGTSQTIGALVSAGVGTSLIQNRRAGTTSTLTVGQGNGNGSFGGIIEDTSATFLGESLSSDGTTGKLAFSKVGSGQQILTNVNLFTGGLSVKAGELQIGTGATGSSSARGGHSAFTIDPTGILSGNGVAGMANLVSTNSVGGKLRVGTSSQTAAQQLQIAGALHNSGTLELDIFSSTLGSGVNTHSDSLLFLNNELINLDGVLSVTDKTATSTTWTAGTWFRVLDWSNVSTTSNRDIGFTSWLLPTLTSGLTWDTSGLATTGRIAVAVIPEPTRGTLAVLGFSLLFLRRSRK